jgi:regulation of enolase protein 1 (concanavalin A-like superfamily)
MFKRVYCIKCLLVFIFVGISGSSIAQTNASKTFLFSEFKFIDIGLSTKPGIVRIDKNELEIKAGGIDIWGNHDGFAFDNKKMKGDFDFSVQVESLSAAHAYTKAGIMARATLNDSSQHVLFQVFPDNRPRNKNNGGCEFQYRMETGGDMKAIYPDLKTAGQRYDVTFPNTWIRLKRAGDIFISYISSDNITWKQYSSFTLKMPHELYVGLAATAHHSENYTTARFKSAQLTIPKFQPVPSFVCTDYTQGKVFVISAKGEKDWEYPAENSNDIWGLPNGNFLFNTGHGVKEVNRKKEVVFSFESKSEIFACQRLANGNTFIGECNSGKLLEVNPQGKIIKTIKLLADSVDGGHAFMRNARKLENGNYLVAHYGLDKVCEYDSVGKLVREIPVKGGPHSVIRLKNGNTLIACSDHNGEPKVVEIDLKGNTVWQLKKDELPDMELKFMTGMQLLPNGNIVLTNWVGHNQLGTAPHAFEITREKKVVWTYNDHSILKTMSSIQLLDSKGLPATNNNLH